jgi:hypothetical protein
MRGMEQLGECNIDEKEQDGEEPIRRNNAENAAAQKKSRIAIEDAGHNITANHKEYVDAKASKYVHAGEGVMSVTKNYAGGCKRTQHLEIIQLRQVPHILSLKTKSNLV